MASAAQAMAHIENELLEVYGYLFKGKLIPITKPISQVRYQDCNTPEWLILNKNCRIALCIQSYHTDIT